MDKLTKYKFNVNDNTINEQKVSIGQIELEKRREEHYKILDSKNYANIIRNF